MPRNLIVLLAWRYLGGVHDTIATMVKVCFIGIAISSFSLTLTMAIMKGFEVAMHEKLQGVHPHLIIRAHGNMLQPEAIARVFEQEFSQVRAWAPTENRHVMIQQDAHDDIGDVMMLKAIDPDRELLVTALGSKLFPPARLTDLQKPDTVIMGKKQADYLHVQAGDTIRLVYPETADHQTAFHKTAVTVVGIFETGIEEYDTDVLWCSFGTLAALFPEAGVSQLGVRLQEGADENKVIQALKKRMPSLEVYSWKELYPALLSATTLERIVMLIILALMALIATLTIVALLFMHITYKRPDIAILYAMGCSLGTIIQTFMVMGLLIAATATTLGMLVALGICLILQKFPFITLPDVYYTTHLPAIIDPWLCIVTWGIIMGLSLLATWYPAHKTKYFSIPTILRHEG